MLLEEDKPLPVRKSFIEGECVMVVTGKCEIRPVHLTKDGVNQTRFGALRHNDCIGMPYGSKVSTSKGHVHILPFNPLLWSVSLPHRTQIIYSADASLIVGFLDLVPGKRIFEAGTGSASLTHFLAQAILPTGNLISYDFHAGRVEQAQQDLQTHNMSGVVTVMHRDVCSAGFPFAGDVDNPEGVDAVVLDLPQPWNVVCGLANVFNQATGGRLCTFSPCFEQVQRTHLALTECGFVNLKTVECLHRRYDVVRATLSVPNMGQLDFPSATSSNADDGRCRSSFLFPQQLPGCSNRIDEDACANRGRKRPHNRSFTWEAMPEPEMVGHSGYLTFASWTPPQSSVSKQ